MTNEGQLIARRREIINNNNISALGALKQSLSAFTIMQIKESNQY